MKKVNKLKVIIEEIEQLIQKNVTSSSPEFQHGKQNKGAVWIEY